MSKGRAKNKSVRKQGPRSKSEQIQELSSEQANRIFICTAGGCNDIATTGKFCRFHYLATWKQSKTSEAKDKGKKLEAYLSDLAQRFPEDFLERLKGEIEEMGMQSEEGDSSSDKSSMYDDQDNSDADIDTIMKGIKVEDY